MESNARMRLRKLSFGHFLSIKTPLNTCKKNIMDLLILRMFEGTFSLDTGTRISEL